MSYIEIHPHYRTIENYVSGLGYLRLLEPLLEYADISLTWTSDASVVQYMGGDFENPALDGEIKRIQEIRDNIDEYSWMIELDGKIIGNAFLNDIEKTTTTYNVKGGNWGILIGDKKYWGKGIGRQVAEMIFGWAFKECDFEIVVAKALNENIASINLLKKLKFEYLGNEPYERKVNGKTTEWKNFKLDKNIFLPN